MSKIIISLFLTGLLFGSGPCIATCGPFLITYIAGTGKGAARGIMLYVLFSLARIAVYVLLSLAIFFLSRIAVENLIGGMYQYVLILGGGFIIIIGLFMALGRRLEFGFWKPLYRVLFEHDKKSIFAVGLIVGLLPCAPLLSILSYIGLVSRTWQSSFLYSLSFGIGTFLSPLILLALVAGLIPRFLSDKKAVYCQVFTFICGLIIIFLGIQLIMRAF
ncbi:MAG: sulfite exporter TauE/SafE family protein [Candidatus Omnitrophica bacterium]|jgi:sulfite exporter TauE/SafE|nr:sulfite exporter TauE/SafE family protein [Candidatus Omnitrophota bacterium]